MEQLSHEHLPQMLRARFEHFEELVKSLEERVTALEPKPKPPAKDAA
jgi:hypothetical protein